MSQFCGKTDEHGSHKAEALNGQVCIGNLPRTPEEDVRWERLRTVLRGRVERMAYASSHLGGITRRGAYEDVLLLMEDIEDLEKGD